MSAGLPGLGLGGLFFVLSALVAPLVELRRTLRGESKPGAWRRVARQFAIALLMILAVDLTMRGVLLVAQIAGASGAGPSGGVTVLPLGPIGLTGLLLASVVVGAKLLQLVLAAGVARKERAAARRSDAQRIPAPVPLGVKSVGQGRHRAHRPLHRLPGHGRGCSCCSEAPS